MTALGTLIAVGLPLGALALAFLWLAAGCRLLGHRTRSVAYRFEDGTTVELRTCARCGASGEDALR